LANAKSLLKLAQDHVRKVVPSADLTALAVSFTLIRAADRLVYDLETVHRQVGWTWPGFRVLFWLWLLGPLEQREIASLISASRASTSSILNTLQRDVAALFPADVQAAAFADDGEFRCLLRALPRGSAVKKGDGWDVDGSWDFCSGVPYATHFIGTTIKSPIDPAVGPELLLFLLPRLQWSMVDDWGDLIGFRGSGSHSIRIEHAHAEPACVIPGRLHDIDVSKGTPGLRLHGNPMYAGRWILRGRARQHHRRHRQGDR